MIFCILKSQSHIRENGFCFVLSSITCFPEILLSYFVSVPACAATFGATKLNKLYSSITCLAVFFGRVFFIVLNRSIVLMSRVFANGPGDQHSIPGRIIPNTQKMVLDAALLNTQHYKARIKCKVEQSKEWSIWNTSRVLKLREYFWDVSSWNFYFLSWLILLAIFTIFLLISLKIFAMILEGRTFTWFKGKSVLLWICILTDEHFLDWFLWGDQKLLHGHF